MARAPRRGPASVLVERRWRLPGGMVVHVCRPSRARLAAVDLAWSALRTPSDVAFGWEWQSTTRDPDLFLLAEEETDAALGLWRASKPTVVLRGSRLYRLDNLEICPGMRAQGLGRFAMTLIATRALELGCAGVVLAAPAVRVQWYRELKAGDASSLGWKCSEELVPLRFDEATLVELQEYARALEEQEVQDSRSS